MALLCYGAAAFRRRMTALSQLESGNAENRLEVGENYVLLEDVLLAQPIWSGYVCYREKRKRMDFLENPGRENSP